MRPRTPKRPVSQSRPRLTKGELGHLQVADPGLFDGRGERVEHSGEERRPPRPATHNSEPSQAASQPALPSGRVPEPRTHVMTESTVSPALAQRVPFWSYSLVLLPGELQLNSAAVGGSDFIFFLQNQSLQT